jgi:aspartate/methionine/tyrosine aminotransferase
MRYDLAKSGNGLTYEIRNIVTVAKLLEKHGVEICYENIGDPVAKGEVIPEWMKETIADIVRTNDLSFAYCPTKGVDSVREFLAEKNNARGGAQITKEDIIFFNGLGDAIARAYSSIRVDARIMLPEPTYSTHLLAEVLHASYPPNTYRMNPYNNWRPDLNELERKVRSSNSVVGILVINPDNPTGYVHTEDDLRQIVRIAKEYQLMLIFDEIYLNMIYNGNKTPALADIIGDVPGISMKGISKEYPWPGARCGWMEIYNADKDEAFSRFVNAILNQKMSEVCSTTLPQLTIPHIMSHPEYDSYLAQRLKHYEKLSNIAYNILKDCPYVVVNRSNGAFYMSVVFNEAVLSDRQKLEIAIPEVRKIVDELTSKRIEMDKRFVYYLLGATGICVVPLTSFFTAIPGFRMTLLEKDVEKFENTVITIKEKIVEYVESGKLFQ